MATGYNLDQVNTSKEDLQLFKELPRFMHYILLNLIPDWCKTGITSMKRMCFDISSSLLHLVPLFSFLLHGLPSIRSL